MSFFNKIFGSNDEETEMEDIVNKNKNIGINIYNKDEKKGDNMNGLKYVVVIPNSFSEAQMILNLIKENKMVTFSIEKLTREEGQRIVDVVSGARHAMNGKIVPVTERVITYLPEGISYTNISKEDDE